MLSYLKSVKMIWLILFLHLALQANLKGVISSHLQNIKVFDYWSTYIGLNEMIDIYRKSFFHTFGYKAGWLASIMRGSNSLPMSSI